MCEPTNSTAAEVVEIKTETPGEVKVEVEEDPYAYLGRDFSSENFKIEVKNMPRYYGVNEFRRFLNNRLKLNSNKIKTVRRNCPYAFVCFRNDEDRENALKILSSCKWKGNQLEAMKARPAPDPLVKKRKEAAEESNPNKKPRIDDRPQEERLKSATTPFWDIKYEEQLKLKQIKMSKVLKTLADKLSHYNQDPLLRKWVDNQRALYDGLPCKLEDIRYADQYEGYRNKCEFSVGIDEETKLATVGFRIGSYVSGTIGVAPVDSLVHIPESMKIAVKVFQDYVRASDLTVYSPEFQTGHFRQLTARSATDQLMLIVGIHPQDLTEDKLADFKKSLIEYFSNGEGKKAAVTSLYYQTVTKSQPREEGRTVPEHLWGDTHIYETILGLKFRISPVAFFQINTKGAEVLYKAALELADPDDQSTVLDVCCGTGTIALYFAQKCKEVLGLELVPESILDAKENASVNNIENAEFFTGKAEEILGHVCFKATNEQIIAVVDPPRAGLHHKAVLRLRKIPKIKKLIYISCNPYAAFQNFFKLGTPETKVVHGDRFVPVRAIPVDMFPFTRHCELLICFERWESVSKGLQLETDVPLAVKVEPENEQFETEKGGEVDSDNINNLE